MRKIAGFSNGIAATSLSHVSASHWSNGTVAQLNDDAFSVLYFFLYVIKKKTKHNFISRKLPSHKVCAKKREKEKKLIWQLFLEESEKLLVSIPIDTRFSFAALFIDLSRTRRITPGVHFPFAKVKYFLRVFFEVWTVFQDPNVTFAWINYTHWCLVNCFVVASISMPWACTSTLLGELTCAAQCHQKSLYIIKT